LTDDGRRGDGRLIAMIRPMPSGALCEFYARQIAGGTRRMVKLGTYPTMTLAAARTAFRDLSPAIREGENVRAHRDKRRTERAALGTLLDICEAYADMLGERRSAKEVRRILTKAPDAACRVIGGYRPACEVQPVDVAAWLRPMHRRAPSSADQARRTLSAAYTWALKCEHDYTIDQPHKWGLTHNPAAMIPADTVAQRAGTRHLSADEFAKVWGWLAYDGGRSDLRACNALRIIMATGQRVEEVLGLTAGQYADGWLRWDKTKMGTAHSIPLPPVVTTILDGMTPNRHGLMIAGCKRPDLPYRDKSANWIARRCAGQVGIPMFSPRDLRRTWRTLAGDAGLSAEECARIMNHAYGSRIEAKHYDKGDNAHVKKSGMDKWSVYLDQIIKKPA
jgi:integrase